MRTLQLILLITAIVSIVTAFVLSRKRRQARVGKRWWIGERRPVRKSVMIGWGSFVVLNSLLALTQPLVAFTLFLRAWVLRAVFLRRPRKGPPAN